MTLSNRAVRKRAGQLDLSDGEGRGGKSLIAGLCQFSASPDSHWLVSLLPRRINSPSRRSGCQDGLLGLSSAFSEEGFIARRLLLHSSKNITEISVVSLKGDVLRYFHLFSASLICTDNCNRLISLTDVILLQYNASNAKMSQSF